MPTRCSTEEVGEILRGAPGKDGGRSHLSGGSCMMRERAYCLSQLENSTSTFFAGSASESLPPRRGFYVRIVCRFGHVA